jgi:hypothetical protein
MHTPYLRRQFDLRGQKIALLVLLGLCWVAKSTPARAQNALNQRRFMEFYDDKTIHYGFFFAAPFTRFNVRHSEAFVNADSTTSIVSPTQPGFRMGFVFNVGLSRRFDFRITPTVSIYGRSVQYAFAGGSERTQLRESTWVEVPLLFKYKSERRGNTRMYVVGGLAFGIEANVRRKENLGLYRERLATKTADVTVEYGVGLERFFEFFKFSPELRFSHGLVNLLDPNVSAYSQGVSRLTSHTVTLYLMFE